MTLQSTDRQKTELQTAFVQDMTGEYRTENQKEVALSSINELGFIERGTGQHQSNTVYGTNGICPCQYAEQHKEPFKVVVNEHTRSKQ